MGKFVFFIPTLRYISGDALMSSQAQTLLYDLLVSSFSSFPTWIFFLFVDNVLKILDLLDEF